MQNLKHELKRDVANQMIIFLDSIKNKQHTRSRTLYSCFPYPYYPKATTYIL